MKNLRFLIVVMVAVWGLTDGLTAYAATCTRPATNNDESGDDAFIPFVCNRAMIDRFWRDFDFDQRDWDEGFGYETLPGCEPSSPLARTMNALYVLWYSAQDAAASRAADVRDSLLRKGYNFSKNNIDELDARCGDGTYRAMTYWGPLRDNRTVLSVVFFFEENVIERAGTIIHEARHAYGKRHNGGRRCPREASCDSHWGFNGANTYQVAFLWWFSVADTRGTNVMRDWARTEAQRVIDSGFVTRPPFSLR